MEKDRYLNIASFNDLNFEIERKHLEVSVIEKQMELSLYELRYQLAPKQLLNFAIKKAIGYLMGLF